jgi:catechol 2,3-dioxygenase-like lactoylglutathione lyase family enzyme
LVVAIDYHERERGAQMKNMFSKMLDRYERGEISRRQLLAGLTAAAAAPVAAADESTFRGVELNHIAIRVTNIPRSRDFYRKHFGFPVASESASSCFLNMERGFLTLFRGDTPRLDHYCIAIRDFNLQKAEASLKAHGITPRVPSGTGRIYFPDPDGIEVQLSAVDHRA